MAESESVLFSSIFLFQFFGEYDRDIEENYQLLKNSMEYMPEWKEAIQIAIEKCSEVDANGLTGMVKMLLCSPRIRNGAAWLGKLLDFTVNLERKEYRSLLETE